MSQATKNQADTEPVSLTAEELRAEELATQEPVKASSNGHGRRVVKLEDIAAAQDLQVEWVPTPEWAPRGSSDEERAAWGVYVRALNGRERAKWQADITIQKGKNTEVNFLAMTVTLIVLGACNEDGSKLFTDADRRVLLNRNSAVLERIGDKVMELSDMGDKEIEAMRGNSTADLADA